MIYLWVLAASTAISLIVIPVMIHYAPRLGMIDHPDPRKVHAQPIPRVGGWGIFLGAILPILALGSFNKLLICYVFGAVVLFIFGSLDDRKEMGHYTKFIGQLIAVLPVVTWGGLYVQSLPFLFADPLPAWIGMPFTVVAMMGVINALNHSDGLDGLAGGESLLSLVAIVYLAYLAKGDAAILIAVATIGGGFGFLRYNTHPASVFMGDGGSQFLGFTLAFLAVLLTQRIDPSLSPAIVLLILGLPIADIIMVLFLRARSGMNWFRATRNHIHHRLLELGFPHPHSVVTIYSVQTVFVVSGVFLRNNNDWLIVSLYFLVCAAVFAALGIGERNGWRARATASMPTLSGDLASPALRFLVVWPRRVLAVAIAGYLVVGALVANKVSTDFGIAGALVFGILLADVFFSRNLRSTGHRVLIYMAAVFILYLHSNYPAVDAMWLRNAELLLFAVLAIAVAAAIRYSPGRREFEFKTTAMDYLMLFMVPTVALVSLTQLDTGEKSLFLVKLVTLFYACELYVIEQRKKWNVVVLASLAAAAIVAIRGLIV